MRNRLLVIVLSMLVLLLIQLFNFSTAYGADQYTDYLYKSYTSSTHGVTLPYRLFIPDGYDSDVEYGLVFALHGLGKRGSDNEAPMTLTITNRWGDADLQAIRKCFVVVPQCPSGETWVKAEPGGYNGSYTWDNNTTIYMKTALEILDNVIATYSIDSTCLYICGSSAGAYATWDTISHYPDEFAAALPCAGGADLSFAPGLVGMPIWAFHGANDTTVPPSGSIEMIDAILAAGGTTDTARLTILPGVGHNSWTPAMALPDVAPWVLAQKKMTSQVHPDLTGFATIGIHWLDTGCVDPLWCDGTDLDESGEVDVDDVVKFTEYWLNWLIHHWELDETSGAVAADSTAYTANACDGTLMNMDDSGWVGGALDFDGVNDYVAIDGACVRMAGKDVTISTWVKAGALNPALQFMIGITTSNGDNRLLLGTKANSAVLTLFDGAFHDTTATVIDNTWHHIAYVLEDSSDTITIYVDGSEALSFTSTVSIAANDVFSLGQKYTGVTANYFYSGQLDEVRVYNRALSEAEIALLAQ